MRQSTGFGVTAAASVKSRQPSGSGIVLGSHWRVVCRDQDGLVKWIEDVDNIVVNVGLNDALDKYFKGSAYTAAHYIGLKGTGNGVAADTMASHAGWSESTAYGEATREVLTLGSVASQSVDNSASPAQFTMNATTTIYGCFLTTVSTKGGTTGTLFCVVNFSAARAVVNTDVLEVTMTLTAAST